MSYAPYRSAPVAGVGAFWSDEKWRWFVVYENGRAIVQRGPVWLSDYGALYETAGFLESTQGRGTIGTVARWDWDPNVRQWSRAA